MSRKMELSHLTEARDKLSEAINDINRAIDVMNDDEEYEKAEWIDATATSIKTFRNNVEIMIEAINDEVADGQD